MEDQDLNHYPPSTCESWSICSDIQPTGESNEHDDRKHIVHDMKPSTALEGSSKPKDGVTEVRHSTRMEGNLDLSWSFNIFPETAGSLTCHKSGKLLIAAAAQLADTPQIFSPRARSKGGLDHLIPEMKIAVGQSTVQRPRFPELV
jgi:hypothetical protein